MCFKYRYSFLKLILKRKVSNKKMFTMYPPYNHRLHFKSTRVMEPHTRQRMRPWLEAKIESCQIRGLEWIERDKKIFKVPWKHGGKHDWNEIDSQIFKEWALHTGRFREGVDQADWPTWKTRFRCALNKLPDIQEMKNYGKLDGPEPFRAYRLLSKHETAYGKNENIYEREEEDPTDSPMDDHYVQEDSMPEKIIKGEIPLDPGVHQSGNLPSDLRELNVQPLPVSLSMDAESNDNATVPLNHISPGSVQNREIDPTLVFKLGYRHQDLGIHRVHNIKGCRLYYGPADMELNAHLQNEVYGPSDVDQVHFPLCNFLENKKQEEMTLNLLNHLDRGIVINVENGQIIATRKCRCTVFVLLSGKTEPVKLNRDEPTIIFDYFNWFEPCLNRSINGRGPIPSAEVLISFGQKWSGGEVEFRSNLIWSKIYLEQAYKQLCKVQYPSIEISNSDNIDQFLRQRVEAQEQMNCMS